MGEHRAKLSKELDSITESYDHLRHDLEREDRAQSPLTIVNRWENESIAKICLAAESARINVGKWTDGSHGIKEPLEQTATELKTCQRSNNYNEIDLQRWQQQLEDFRHQLERVPQLETDNDEDTIRMIRLGKKPRRTNNDSMNGSLHSDDQSTTHLGNFHTLVPEKFHDVTGAVTLTENAQVATYSGSWLGHPSICGINLYSSEKHHINFRVVEKFYDSPFFGVITASQKNTPQVLDAASTYGWLNFEYPVAKGVKQQRMDRDKIIRPLDDLTLTLDCERRQIFLRHHRTGRLLHLPIDLRVCPYPWKVLVMFFRRGDAVRILGGTLTLTKENLPDKITERHDS